MIYLLFVPRFCAWPLIFFRRLFFEVFGESCFEFHTEHVRSRSPPHFKRGKDLFICFSTLGGPFSCPASSFIPPPPLLNRLEAFAFPLCKWQESLPPPILVLLRILLRLGQYGSNPPRPPGLCRRGSRDVPSRSRFSPIPAPAIPSLWVCVFSSPRAATLNRAPLHL